MSATKYNFISCKCITHGRVDLLEEAIESFLMQDYPPNRCELIIVNDYPLQTLKYNLHNIHIYNKSPFETIGDKENYATSKCRGDIICQWDDDDIALPNHLQNVNKYFTKDTDLLHWSKGIYSDNGAVTSIGWIGNSGLVFRKSAWKDVGGHPKENAGYDRTFVNLLTAGRKVTYAAPPDKEVSWVYRWGSSTPDTYHMSGQGDDTDENPNILIRHAAHIENLRVRGKIPTGEIYLHPKWKKSYIYDLHQFIKSIKKE